MGRVRQALLTQTQTQNQTADMAGTYDDIDFEEINEATGLANDEIKCLKICFDLFDTKKQEFLSGDDLGEIMRAMGFRPTEEELVELLHEVDACIQLGLGRWGGEAGAEPHHGLPPGHQRGEIVG